MNGTKATAHAQLDKLRIERDEACNHADKLAFALRQIAYAADVRKATRQAKEALAAYEEAQ